MAPDRPRRTISRAISMPIAAPCARLGLAVSGGPTAWPCCARGAARPGLIEAATVDHALRPEAAARSGDGRRATCAALGVPHATLNVPAGVTRPRRPPGARAPRALSSARLLGRRAFARCDRHRAPCRRSGGNAAHAPHPRRGRARAGRHAPRVRSRREPTSACSRPLLGWRRAELEQVCADAGLDAGRGPQQ